MDNEQSKISQRRRKQMQVVISILTSILIVIILEYNGFFKTHTEINNQDFLNMMNNKTSVDKIVVNEIYNKAYIYTTEQLVYVTRISKNGDFGLKMNYTEFDIEYVTERTMIESILNMIVSNFLGISIFILTGYVSIKLLFFLINFFKSKKVDDADDEKGGFSLITVGTAGEVNNDYFQIIKDIKIKFGDVVGQKTAKLDLQECIQFLKCRDEYINAGYKIPRGFIFTGPPGTGKTLLGKALAGEAGVTFIYLSGSDFIEKYVGVGAQRVRNLFSLARKSQPAIIFIDEIDAIGRKREGQVSMGGYCEHSSTLNKLLSEMDGFQNNDNILVIGATNSPDILDPALTRSGRFDKEIVFDQPNKDERIELFNMYLTNKTVSKAFSDNKQENLVNLARMTAGLSGADIANIVNQSVLVYIRRKNEGEIQQEEQGVTVTDIVKSIDVIMIGVEKRERQMTDRERHIVAYHESGHTIISYILKDCSPPIKVSIVPRGRSALGFTQQEPSDQKLYTYNELINKICVLLGGRAAEELVYSHLSTGAHDDIEKVTELVYNMIIRYGMGSIGPLCCKKNSIKISENLQMKIDDQAQNLVSNLYERTLTVIKQNREALDKLSDYLYENETIVNDDIDRLLEPYNIKDTIEKIDQ